MHAVNDTDVVRTHPSHICQIPLLSRPVAFLMKKCMYADIVMFLKILNIFVTQ